MQRAQAGRSSVLETAGNVAGGGEEALANRAAGQWCPRKRKGTGCTQLRPRCSQAMFKQCAGNSGGKRPGPSGMARQSVRDRRQNVVDWERKAQETIDLRAGTVEEIRYRLGLGSNSRRAGGQGTREGGNPERCAAG